MDDNTLKHFYGQPKVWLFSTNGVELEDTQGIKLSEYVTSLEYSYDEEEDDFCKVKFLLPNKEVLELPYLIQDVVIRVQWGYILPGGELLKSPVRTVAIRDLKNGYSVRGIELELDCTDLVSYIKLFNTSSSPRYSRLGIEQSLNLKNRFADHFLDYMDEISEGKVVFTAIQENYVRRVDTEGNVSYFEYDEVNNVITRAIDNTAVPRTFFHTFRTQKKTIGDSASLNNSIEDKLKFLMDQLRGNFISNTTDNHLMIHNRNFKQIPFKKFTWAGGNGELISFKPTTTTRLVKENVSTNNVNPYTKSTENINVSALDFIEKNNIESLMSIVDEGRKNKLESTEENQNLTENETRRTVRSGGEVFYVNRVINGQDLLNLQKALQNRTTIPEGFERKYRPSGTTPGGGGGGGGWSELPSNRRTTRYIENESEGFAIPAVEDKGYTSESLDSYAKYLWDLYLNDIDLQEGPTLPDNLVFAKRLLYTDSILNPLTQKYSMISANPWDPPLFTIMSYTPQQVINNIPEFRDIVEDRLDQFREASKEEASRLKANALVGYVLEKIVRKYEGTAVVLGDPSLIKSRTYLLENLSSLDSGVWYATKVTHKVDFKSGYTTELKLIKKPQPVGISKSVYEAKLNITEEELTKEGIVYQDNRVIFDPLERPLDPNTSFKEGVEGMEERLSLLYSQDELINNTSSRGNSKSFRGKDKPLPNSDIS